MRKLIIVILALVYVGCSDNNVGNCTPNELLLCDSYLAELENKSRYIKVKGIKGNRIESKYLPTEQIHKFECNNQIIQLKFYHSLIVDQIENETIVENQLRKLHEVKFGIVQIDIYPQTSLLPRDPSKQRELIHTIEIEEFENSQVLLLDREPIHSIPVPLLEIGALNFEKSINRKVLTISTPNDSLEQIIEKLYSNIELLYKYLKNGDIIDFLSTDSENDVVRSYILVDSFGEDTDMTDWCGVGPKIKRFECIYIKNNDL